MTVINGIEVGNIKYIPNNIHISCKTGKKIEDKLNVIMVISNPCKFIRRYYLAHEFILRMRSVSDVNLYIVELEYGDNPHFEVTDSKNPNHLQIHIPTLKYDCNTLNTDQNSSSVDNLETAKTIDISAPIWHKENMINVGIRKLLPANWKAVAWIDADVEFDNIRWAEDTLKILGSGNYDVLQIFSHCLDMNKDENVMNVFSSFGFQYTHLRPYTCDIGGTFNYWHPGFAWACTRSAYDKMGGLIDIGVLGSGDHHMAMSFIGKGRFTARDLSDNYKKEIDNFEERCNGFRVGYVPGVIRHYFHGSKKNRKYVERREILKLYNFDPNNHLTRVEMLETNNFNATNTTNTTNTTNVNKKSLEIIKTLKNKYPGLLVPSINCPYGLLNEINNYFKIRNEDEFFTYS